MTIVMGSDQHRAQITAEWIDTETGEIARSRVAPAHREPVRRFLARFAGQELEVALEATTGGGSWLRSCGGSARWCIWRSQRRRRGCAGRRSGPGASLPRPTALSLRAVAEPLLRDCDFGRWAGRPIAEVERDEGERLAQWLAEPAAAPHGGESIVALIARAGTWLAGLEKLTGQIVAITHQSVIRATLVHALDASPHAFWRIDVPPLAIVELTHNEKRWALSFRESS